MNTTPRTDYVDAAQARLPRFFRDKPRFFAVVAAMADSVQDFESYVFGMYEPRFLANAVGAVLDVYGGIVGQERLGLSDASYRLRIRARMALNRSSGTNPDLVSIANLLVEPGNTVLYRESYPAAVLMQIAGAATALELDVYQVLYAAKAGGVSFRLTTQDGPDAERFVFTGGVGLGWGGYPTDWVGTVSQKKQGLVPAALGPVSIIDSNGTGALPIASLNGSPVPSGLGTIVIRFLDDVTFSWLADNGMGAPEVNAGTSVDLVDENTAFADSVGISVAFDTIGVYELDDAYQFTVTDEAMGDSTAPVITTTGPLTTTGRITFQTTTGTPSYWFRYKRPDGTFSATQTMNRGVAIPLTHADFSPLGLSVTWPNVDTYYTGAEHAVHVSEADATVGGRWTNVR